MKALLILGFLFFTACATITPDSEMNAMGTNYFSQLKKKQKIERDPRTNAYVKCVVGHLLKYTEDSTGVTNWEVVVFKDNSANAFALPGGKIGVHTGILKVAKTQDQLAAVLGHEIGHVIKRHGGQRMAKAKNAQMVSLGAGVLATVADVDARKAIAITALAADYAFLKPHGRKNESEADIEGLKIMAKAGFNPNESVKLWQNMQKAGGAKLPEWLSTHPSGQTRIGDLRKEIPSVWGAYQQARSSGQSPKCG